MHKIDVVDSSYSVYDRPTFIFENHIILKFTFHQIYSKQSGLKAPNYLRKRLNSIPTKSNIGPQAILLNDFAVYSTTFARSVQYKVFPPVYRIGLNFPGFSFWSKTKSCFIFKTLFS